MNSLANNLNIIEINSSCSFQLKINTKYYHLESTLTVVSFSNNFQLAHTENLQGYFILLNKTDDIVYLKNEFFQNLLAENKTCLKILIQNEKTLELIKLTENYDDLILIELDLNQEMYSAKTSESDHEEDYDELDEFVNSLIVHNWTRIKSEDCSKQPKDQVKLKNVSITLTKK